MTMVLGLAIRNHGCTRNLRPTQGLAMKKFQTLHQLVGLACAFACLFHVLEAEASCNAGCDSGYWSASSCYCDDYCVRYGDCCVDYAAQCMAPPSPQCNGSRSWRPAVLLQARPSFAALARTYPDVGTAADGTATVIWRWSDYAPMGFRGVRARRFSAGAWSAAADVAIGPAFLSGTPSRIAMGAGGHGFVTLPTGEMKRFLPASGWSPVSTAALPAVRTSFERAVDSAGSFMYMYESGGWLRVRRRANVWESEDTLGTPTPSPHLAANSSGDFGTIFNPSYAYAMRRDEPEGPAFTARATALSASSGRVGVADDGTVLGVWFGTGNTVQFARLSTAAITPAVPIATYATGALYNLRLAVNGAGQAIASWVHTAAFNFDIIAAVYDPSTGWSAPTTLALSALATLGSVPTQEIGIDGCGGAHLVHEDRHYTAHAFDFKPGVGWGPRHTFSGPALDIRLATAANGVTTVAWDNDQNEVLAARFE
jgi:hypothetical protein